MRITLRAARVNAGLTQAEACRALGLSKGTVASYEANKTMPTIEMAKKFAELYGCKVEDIKFFS